MNALRDGNLRQGIQDALLESGEWGNRRRWCAAACTCLGLLVGFGVVFAGASMVLGGAIVIAGGLIAIPFMGRRAGPWRIAGAGIIYGLAFALAHPLAMIITAWPAAGLAALIAGAATYELTPRG